MTRPCGKILQVSIANITLADEFEKRVSVLGEVRRCSDKQYIAESSHNAKTKALHESLQAQVVGGSSAVSLAQMIDTPHAVKNECVKPWEKNVLSAKNKVSQGQCVGPENH